MPKITNDILFVRVFWFFIEFRMIRLLSVNLIALSQMKLNLIVFINFMVM